MDLEKRLDIYKTDYLFQIDLKEKIYTRMALFSVFITASITANFSMQDELIKLSSWQISTVVFLWIIGAIILLYIMYSFFNITTLKTDKLVNSSTEMENYRNTLRDHYIKHTQNISDQELNNYIDEQFKIYLLGQYSYCSSIFNENNIFRQQRVSKIAICSYILLIITFCVSLFFVFHKFKGEQNVTQSNPTSTSTSTCKRN